MNTFKGTSVNKNSTTASKIASLVQKMENQKNYPRLNSAVSGLMRDNLKWTSFLLPKSEF